jgi:hypothetical protein
VRITSVAVVSLSAVLFCGCESLDINESDVAQAVNDAQAAASEASGSSSQSDETTSPINWLGPNLSSAVLDGTLHSAKVSGDNVVLSYSIGWGAKVPSGMKSEMQGMVCFFRDRNGTLVGGKYEWFRKGQTVRSLHNIHSGYNGHTVPGRGEKVYFCLADVDGKRRTPIVSTTW